MSAWRWLIATALVASAPVSAHGDERDGGGDDDAYRRVTVSVNAPYLLVPVYQLGGELAVHERVTVGARAGAGRSDTGGTSETLVDVGVQAAYYVTGNASRGIHGGIDARHVSTGGDTMLFELDDGVAIGPFVGYKRAFTTGLTLGAQLGVELPVSGTSDGPVTPHFALLLGWSFLRVGDAAPEPTPAATERSRDPLDHHRGLLLGFAIGGGAAGTEACSACEMEPGIAVDATVGWFVSRRVALELDTTALVGLVGGGTGSAALALESVAVQYWPRHDVWLKAGVGVARLISASLVAPPALENGGGGTLAAGYEFHHDRSFAMDAQLRATHGSFEHHDGSGTLGVNTFVGLVGVRWY